MAVPDNQRTLELSRELLIPTDPHPAVSLKLAFDCVVRMYASWVASQQAEPRDEAVWMVPIVRRVDV